MPKLTFAQVLNHLLHEYFGCEEEFTMNDIVDKTYSVLLGVFPANNTIAASIRTNLQTLQDKNLIEFVEGQGVYRWPAA